MNRSPFILLVLGASVAAVITGCASPPAPPQSHAAPAGSIGQSGIAQVRDPVTGRAQFIACNPCPGPTPKTLPGAAPAPAPVKVAPALPVQDASRTAIPPVVRASEPATPVPAAKEVVEDAKPAPAVAVEPAVAKATKEPAPVASPAPKAIAIPIPAVAEENPKVAWVVQPGGFLRATLREWSERSGWSLVWGLPDQEDFRLEAGNTFREAEFKGAVHGLFDSLPATVRIRAELRPDNVPPMIHVTREEGSR